MGRPIKKISEFDVRLGKVVRSKRVKAGLSRAALAEKSGVAEANIKRRELGTNEITVSELQRIAVAVKVAPVELVEEALHDYGGLEKLLAEYITSDDVVIVTDEDNVTMIFNPRPDLADAAKKGPRVRPKE